MLTTRRHPTDDPKDSERAIGIALSEKGEFVWNTTTAPPLTLRGTTEHQIYAQVTFRWHQLYMGIAMVYDTTDTTYNRVHCRLVVNSGKDPTERWSWVDPGGLTGRDFIPLGDIGPPGTDRNSFDSHLCYAAPPTVTESAVRLYYMGSDGKHSGSRPPRNASLGVAFMRPDGYAGMRGVGNMSTVPVLVTHANLTTTLDILPNLGSGFVRIGVRSPNSTQFYAGLSPQDSSELRLNGTDRVVSFAAGRNLGHLIGQEVVLVLEMQGAIVYTVGFQ